LWRQGKGDYFQALLFLAELITPFVSLGKVLLQVWISRFVFIICYHRPVSHHAPPPAAAPSTGTTHTLLHNAQRRAPAALLPGLPGAALPVPLLGLQPVGASSSSSSSSSSGPMSCCVSRRFCSLPAGSASLPVIAVPLVAPWQCNLGGALLWPLNALLVRANLPARSSDAGLGTSGRRLKKTPQPAPRPVFCHVPAAPSKSADPE
ncbi:unnamed protein product, partial [Tetraodon nigroviridis]